MSHSGSLLFAFGALAVVVGLALAFPNQLHLASLPKKPPAPEFKLSECRDGCEQRATVERLDDARLRECRADCERKAAGAAHDGRVNEPIGNITRAPADHHLTVRPENPIEASPRSRAVAPNPQ